MPPLDPIEMLEAEVSESLSYLVDSSLDVQKVSLAVYRILAEGTPVSHDEVARRLGMDAQAVSDTIGTFPPSAIDVDADGRVVGFFGLSIEPANHRILVRDKTLYTWCVFDALFLSEIFGSALTVQTRCPASSTEIEVHVNPTGVASSKPPNVVMSVVTPDAESCRTDLRSTFCNHVTFFESETAFQEWAKSRTDARCVDLGQAFAMGQARNREVFPDVEYLA